MPRRILLVVDNPEQREAYARMLSEAGHAVTAVAHAGVALSQLAIVPFDLLLADYLLSDLPGTDLIIRARDTGRSLATVLMGSSPDLHELAEDCGADGCYDMSSGRSLSAILGTLPTFSAN